LQSPGHSLSLAVKSAKPGGCRFAGDGKRGVNPYNPQKTVDKIDSFVALALKKFNPLGPSSCAKSLREFDVIRFRPKANKFAGPRGPQLGKFGWH